MAVFRVEKTKDFTVMSNHHLRNTELSLKAKGLLSATHRRIRAAAMWPFLRLPLTHFPMPRCKSSKAGNGMATAYPWEAPPMWR